MDIVKRSLIFGQADIPSASSAQSNNFNIVQPKSVDSLSLSTPNDKYQRSPAMMAAIQGDNRALAAIVAENPISAIVKPDIKGQTVLDYLMLRNNLEGLQIVLTTAQSAGVDVSTLLNTPDDVGFTRLALAAANGKYDACKIYMEHGAQPILPATGVNSPHIQASMMGWSSVADLLGASQYPIEMTQYRHSPAVTAAIQGNTEQLTSIIRRNPEVILEKDIKGQTVLDYLMLRNNIDGIQQVLTLGKQAGLDIPKLLNTPDVDGYTRLSWAAENGNKFICNLYLNYGANPVIPEAKLNSPHIIADMMGWQQTKQLF